MRISCLLFLFLSWNTYAANMCSPSANFKTVDLKSEMGPLRNQGGLGWCYAFAASDLMTHYLYKKGKIKEINSKTMVSPLSVGAKYNKKFFEFFSPENEYTKKLANEESEALIKKKVPGTSVTSTSTTKPAQVMTRSLKEGDILPWEKIGTKIDYPVKMTLPDSVKEKFKNKNWFFGSIANDREAYFKSLTKMSSNDFSNAKIKVVPTGGFMKDAILTAKDNYCTESEARSGDIGLERFDLNTMLKAIFDTIKENNIISCSSLQNFQKMLPGTELKDIFTILKTSTRQSAYTALVDKACKRKMSEFNNEPEVGGWRLPGDYLKKPDFPLQEAQKVISQRMDEILNKGTPVAIDYNSYFLYDHKESDDLHASTIVGKVFNQETCKEEYILRNSYGEGCSLYQKRNDEYINCIASANKEKDDVAKNKLRSLCDKNKKVTYLNPKVRCEEGTGYLYIEKEELVKNLLGITFIKE